MSATKKLVDSKPSFDEFVGTYLGSNEVLVCPECQAKGAETRPSMPEGGTPEYDAWFAQWMIEPAGVPKPREPRQRYPDLPSLQ